MKYLEDLKKEFGLNHLSYVPAGYGAVTVNISKVYGEYEESSKFRITVDDLNDKKAFKECIEIAVKSLDNLHTNNSSNE